MFKPFRILQASLLALALSGCATTKTHPAAPTAAAPVAGTGAVTTPSSIQAGQSISGSTSFQDAGGRLRPDIEAYAREVSQARGVPLPRVEAVLKAARYNATVARLMQPSSIRVRRSWVTYRKRFVDPIRIRAGAQFWMENQATLDAAASRYGVPQSIIVAIIGVETIYGRQTGGFPVIDALATLGFSNPDDARPERSRMFRNQLADLIQLDHEKKLNALEVEGSYAGAIGLPQFMPGSIMRYAVDGDGDGHIDLLYDPKDAIPSVANYLREHGWVPGLPVFAPVLLPPDAGALVAGGIVPSTDWAKLQARGARTRPGAANTAWQRYPLGVVDLVDEPRNLKEYRTGTPNFFAITHYNHSYFYAASVADLAQAIADNLGLPGPD